MSRMLWVTLALRRVSANTRNRLGQAEALVHLPQQQDTAVADDITTIERSLDDASPDPP